VRVRRVEERLQLLAIEIVDERLVGLLNRDRMDPTRLVETRGEPIFQEPEEGVDGCQPRVARPRRVAALTFDVHQERQDQRRIQLLDLDLAWFDVQPVRREADQKLEAVGVGFASVLAGFPLARQMLAQECGEMRSQRGHAAAPQCNASPAAAICPIKIGVACRYQYRRSMQHRRDAW
jgi:hypothetical protein